jgi:NAD(P)-dependent dehydrogenase (short-subunit alcohol dehydrogenase family)
MTTPVFGLAGRRVLVTGAAGGIGSALLDGFRSAGARLVVCDRPGPALEALDAERRLGFDLGAPDQIDAALASLTATGAVPDVIVNNAGYTRQETLRRSDPDEAAREIAVNLTGTLRLTAGLLPAMAAQGGGAIVFVASVNALLHVGNPAYSAAKAGMLAWCRAVAVEYGRAGIRANAVCPGSVRTPAWDHRLEKDPEVVARTARFYPLGRLVEPHEVAAAVLFLASPLASAITGVALPVDCGLSAGNLDFVRTVLGE